jgi:hypothetical protein
VALLAGPIWVRIRRCSTRAMDFPVQADVAIQEQVFFATANLLPGSGRDP